MLEQLPQLDKAPEQKEDLTSANILVVEDDDSWTHILHEGFSMVEFNAIFASTVQDGLRLLNKHKFDVVVTDLGLPGGSGVDIAREAKRLNKDTSVILFSGSMADPVVQKLVHDEPIDAIVPKEAGLFRLIDGIRVHLNHF